MTFWSGDTLEKKLGKEEIVSPFCKGQVDCAAYTLRMGSEAFKTSHHESGKNKIEYLSEHEDFNIPAGQFAWLLTEEYIKMPNYLVAFLSIRTTIKCQGLINVSGFHVDPGFEGRLIYAVYNAGPREIKIRRGDKIFLI